MAVEISSGLEGLIGEALWYHFDCDNDGLYLRLASAKDKEMFGEETAEGFTLFRTDDGRVVGMTIVGYWQQFGHGTPEAASLSEITSGIEQFASSRNLAA